MVDGEVLKIPEEINSGTTLTYFDGKIYYGSGCTIINSGTTLTYFAEPAYEIIKEAVMKKIKGYEVVEGTVTGISAFGALGIGGDLLPPAVPDYRTSARLLSAQMHPRLTNDEHTKMLKLAKAHQTHMSKNLQGLANAILKLWEKSLVAEIAVKPGVQNTNNEPMALELKVLNQDEASLLHSFVFGEGVLPQSVWLKRIVSVSLLFPRTIIEFQVPSMSSKSLGGALSELQHSHDAAIIFDALYATNSKEMEPTTTTSHVSNMVTSSQVSKHSSKSPLIQIGMNGQVTNILKEIILQVWHTLSVTLYVCVCIL
ncbi:CRM-domain containing factor CFM3, chloroplastic/mitochondrial [Trifolium repens]|nr:CRM-domain containing factor CFM3, chloroplastic/mitochondrial [Trifolium repens]